MSDVFATGWRTNAVGARDVQTVQRNGREYLKFPLVPLTEMVLHYPENGTKEYLPAEHIRETAGLWDGALLTYVHPENRNQTVRDPDEFMGSVIGAFHDPRALDGGEKLRGNGLIDVEKATDLGGTAAELVGLLRNGEQVSVSAGYTTTDDEHRSGRFDGEQYDLVQGPPLPDHIAVFPSDSRVQARCSPEDGCAAPKANASQDQNGQRATNGVRANMSETETNDSAVDMTEEQRQMTDGLSSMLAEVESSGVASDRQTEELRRLRNVVDGLGQMLEQGETDVGPALGTVVQESKALVADILNETTEPTDEKTNAGVSECDCAGVCRHNPSISGSDGTGASVPNMTAVPGRMNRDVERSRGRQRENVEEYPAGGRSNWEKRTLNIDREDDDDLPPAGGRSAYERRRQRRRTNAASDSTGDESGAGDESFPTGSRSSFEQRHNAAVDVDPSEWVDHSYPLTAKRAAERSEKKRRRWENLREQAKRNDTNTVRKRHNSSDGSQ